jgi:hypothetical protein
MDRAVTFWFVVLFVTAGSAQTTTFRIVRSMRLNHLPFPGQKRDCGRAQLAPPIN